LGHVFKAFYLGHGGVLVEKLAAVHGVSGILILNLRDYQGDELVFHLGCIADVNALLYRFVNAIRLSGTVAGSDPGHHASPNLSKPCCMLLMRLRTSTLVSKLRLADIMSVISSISL